jgi:hypothetical protein
MAKAQHIQHELLTPEILKSPLGQMIANLLINGDSFKLTLTKSESGELIHCIECRCVCAECLESRGGANKNIFMYRNLIPDFHETDKRETNFNNQQ